MGKGLGLRASNSNGVLKESKFFRRTLHPSFYDTYTETNADYYKSFKNSLWWPLDLQLMSATVEHAKMSQGE